MKQPVNDFHGLGNLRNGIVRNIPAAQEGARLVVVRNRDQSSSVKLRGIAVKVKRLEIEITNLRVEANLGVGGHVFFPSIQNTAGVRIFNEILVPMTKPFNNPCGLQIDKHGQIIRGVRFR